jgi:predicted TIM-barrel fold metal-dependent hydrolase
MSGSSLRERFLAEGRLADCPIYDLHGHWGPHYGIHMPAADEATANRLFRQANVKRLVMCHHATLFTPDAGNTPNIEAVRRWPAVLRAYCGINPNYPDVVAQDLAQYDRYSPDVFVGFKLLADYHKVAVSDAPYQPVWEFAQARKLMLLLHTWGNSSFDGYVPVRAVAQRYPDTRILLGHSLHGDWDHAIELAREFPNVYLELTAVLDERGVVERFVAEAGSHKVVYGTDFPWFSHYYYIGALLGAGLGDEDLRNILYRNAQRLLGEPVG